MSLILTDLTPSVTFSENTVNVAPQLIDSDVTLTSTSSSFDGGQLTLSGLTADDIVSVRNQGAGAGQIGLSGSDVTFEGVVIGTLTGGQGTTLTVSLNAAATASGIEALVENLTFANTSNTPSADRTLTLNITDADGNSLSETGPSVPTFAQQATGSVGLPTGSLGAFALPTFVDLDVDGDLDLVVGLDNNLRVFQNTNGTFAEVNGASNPLVFVTDIVRVEGQFAGFPPFDNGIILTAFGDYDLDGDMDLVVQRPSLSYLRNESGIYDSTSAEEDPFLSVFVEDPSGTAMADLDGDGDQDFIGVQDIGVMNYWRNDDGVYSEQTGSANPLNGIDPGNNAVPTFGDLDNDGDLDMVTGDDTGQLRVWMNMAGGFAELTGSSNPFAGVTITGKAAPALVDMDGDNDLDLVVGDTSGSLSYFENTGTVTPDASTTTIDVHVTPENDAPTVNNVLDTLTVTSGVATPLDLSDVNISDEDGGQIILFLSSNVGTFAATSSATVTASPFTDVDGRGQVALVGTAIDIMAYLDTAGIVTFTFNPALPDFGFKNILCSVQDFDFAGGDTPVSGELIDLTVLPPQNEPPTLSNVPGSATVTQGAATGLDLSGLELDDPDGGEITLALTSMVGTFAAISTATVTASSFVAENGQGQVSLTGSAADILAYLDTVGAVSFTLGSGPFPGGLAEIQVVVFDSNTAEGTYVSQTEVVELNVLTPFPTITGTAGKDALIGTTGAEIINALGSDDMVRGLGGADTMDGGAGRDTLHFGSSNAGVTVDLNTGETGYQSASGGHATGDVIRGFESVVGSSHADNLTGDAVANTLNGGVGNDTLTGNGGNDALIAGRGADVISGGSGSDTAIYSGSTAGVVIDLRADGLGRQYAALGDAEGDVLTGIENVRGSSHNDVLIGNIQRNTLQGGAGADTFVFATALTASNSDKIGDFRVGQDVIELHQAIFTAVTPEDWLAGQFEVNTTGLASTTETRVIYESDTGRLYYDANGNLGGGSVLFATLSRNLALTADDFVIQGLEVVLT